MYRCVMCKGPIIKVGHADVVIALTWNAWASICPWCVLMPTGGPAFRRTMAWHNGKFLRFTLKSTNMTLITSLENTIAESNM
ncbi:hypothetical protein RJT34_12252 [Clitoria ternatea]|uniref:Uncharacterized protein n=1 Tax=Clitoria ternatea TaxID=43366 RepID=A0AAN9JQ03_CLITE